jgi:hypothetical protein
MIRRSKKTDIKNNRWIYSLKGIFTYSNGYGTSEISEKRLEWFIESNPDLHEWITACDIKFKFGYDVLGMKSDNIHIIEFVNIEINDPENASIFELTWNIIE